jgi:hypothetical protein
MSDEPEKEPITKGQGILEGTLAQIAGGSLASTIVIGLASFDVFMQAGFESAFGTLLGVVFYIVWKNMRAK